MNKLNICAISDTHTRFPKIPECDLLIHCGDWTNRGEEHEVKEFAQWLDVQDAKYIVVIPGNHELVFERCLPNSLKWFTDYCPGANLLIDQTVEIEGIKIHGSPATPFFCDWAWNRSSNSVNGYHRSGKSYFPPPIKPHWDAIPNDTNILITHGPPYGILDQTTYANGDLRPDHLGCQELMNRIQELKDLKFHFFGHIHFFGGTQVNINGVNYCNSAVCDEQYYPSNPLTIVEYIK